ncbi:hypothetical protein E1A91_A06G003200v1 [Gossypium mustelinum]|uniref:Uncharacterized protein n=1 Tax=Gossypium mustelinum TaxID=34275 RepID=A0A5D2YPV7_GOSMU|nr:hypothetical protein E1A91_A06G003200v1 [Gossypium mustelinum]
MCTPKKMLVFTLKHPLKCKVCSYLCYVRNTCNLDK